MCGITGLFDPEQRLAAETRLGSARAMTGALTHRGPDTSGVWTDDVAGVALGHRRLSIIDLSPAGDQPMTSADGRWTMVYNGELYNTETLRTQLPQRSYRGHSDTAVLLETIACRGVEHAVTAANGMFALAVWDHELQQLWLARDRFGEKPLYWGHHQGMVIFASELSAFAQLPGWAPQVDREALSLMLRHNSIPAPWSIFEGIHKLPAGHLLRIDAGHMHPDTQCYWSPVTTAANARSASTGLQNPAQVGEELNSLLTDIVSSRMVSDVPLWAFLSGGIDSSTVVALMQQVSAQPVRTFTIGFDEAGYDESSYAATIAKHLGTNHTELRVSHADALAVVPQLAKIYAEPFADSSQIPTYLVSALAKSAVTVALSGDGGDELFGG
jgi:asparagine synthase (glutamine-hydrolysing)